MIIDRNYLIGAIQESIEGALESGYLPDRRERIATAAMQGLLANEYIMRGAASAPGGSSSLVPDAAVEYADALIARLDAQRGGEGE